MFRFRRYLAPAAAFARGLSRVAPPVDTAAQPVIRVSNNLARLGPPKEGPKPRQLLSLPPFPADGVDALPGRKISPENVVGGSCFRRRVTAITWVKHYFDEVPSDVIQRHFRNGMTYYDHLFDIALSAACYKNREQLSFIKQDQSYFEDHSVSAKSSIDVIVLFHFVRASW